MRIVAFGDSITAGQNGLSSGVDGLPLGCATLPPLSATTQSLVPQFIDLATSYPTQLQTMLDAAFVPGPAVANWSVPGETSAEGAARLQGQLASCAADALLLLEGINDIDSASSATAAVAQVLSALQSDVNTARAVGVKYVFLGTLLPQRTCVNNGIIECAGRLDNLAAINSANTGIKAIGATSGVPVVDLNAAFSATDPTLVSLISNDGLHPTAAGSALVARTFYSAMVAGIPVTSLRLPAGR
jgi:lysophospholipase L1-like esterase